MSNHQQAWQVWAERLQRWGGRSFWAWLLEATEPVNLIAAQMVYIAQPLLDGFVPAAQLTSLAAILEEPQETRAFITFLREAGAQ